MKFSHSRINTFKQCPKLFDYKYNQNLVKIDGDSESLMLGKAFHRGIELGDVNKLEQELDNNEDFMTEENETNKVIVLAMVEAFFNKFPHHNDGDVKHEVKIETQFGGHDFIMFADALVEEPDGFILREYKTASRIDKTYIDKLKFNDQISRYCLAIEQVYGKRVKKIEYYVAKKPLLRLKQNETLEQFRQRLVEKISEDEESIQYFELGRTREQLDEEFEDLIYDMNTIESTNRYTKNLSACSCYGNCPYLELCMKEKDALLLYEVREDENER